MGVVNKLFTVPSTTEVNVIEGFSTRELYHNYGKLVHEEFHIKL